MMDFTEGNVWSGQDYTCDNAANGGMFSFSQPKPLKKESPKKKESSTPISSIVSPQPVGPDGLTKAERKQKNRELMDAARAAKLERKRANRERQEEIAKQRTEEKTQRAQEQVAQQTLVQLAKRDRKRKHNEQWDKQKSAKRAHMSDVVAKFKKAREDYATNVSLNIRALVDDYCRGLRDTPGRFSIRNSEINDVKEAPIIPLPNEGWADVKGARTAPISIENLDFTFPSLHAGASRFVALKFPSINQSVNRPHQRCDLFTKKLEDEMPTVDAQAKYFASIDLATVQGRRLGESLLRQTMKVPKEKREELWKKLHKTIDEACESG